MKTLNLIIYVINKIRVSYFLASENILIKNGSRYILIGITFILGGKSRIVGGIFLKFHRSNIRF